MSKSRYRDGDLIVLEKSYGKVHIVWTDTKYGVRICRPSMLKHDTDDPWRILKRDVDPRNFNDEVHKQGKHICKECLSWCPDAY